MSHSERKKGPPESELVRTDADGRFEAFVLPGEVGANVVGKVPGLLPEAGRGWREHKQVVAAKDGIFELEPIEMLATKTITGRLVDQFNHPLGEIELSANDEETQRLDGVKTAADGSFSLEVPADAEPTFEARPPGVGFVDVEIVQANPLVLHAADFPAAGKKALDT